MIQAPQDSVNGFFSKFFFMYIHCSEPRQNSCRKGCVIKTDNGNVLWNLVIQFLKCVHQKYSGVVIGANKCFRHFMHLSDRIGQFIKVMLNYRFFNVLQSRKFENILNRIRITRKKRERINCFPVTCKAFFYAHGVIKVTEKSNFSVAILNQQTCYRIAALLII